MNGMRWLSLGGLMVALAACGGGEGGTAETERAPSADAAASATPGVEQPDPGRRVIEVEMLTDLANGGANVFRPANFEAHRGDVIRFKLVSGVHNAHFVADSNPTMTNPPAASPMLQAPGQTWDVKVTWPEGHYFFQCDPHALLGMVGRVEVEDEH
jgi:plastocyanin